MIAGHLQEKYGFFYIVLSYRDDQGKRHTPWFPTRLPVKGNKKRAEAMLLEMRKTYVPPVSSTENPPVDPQTGLVFADFLQQWLCVAKSTVMLTTYASYAGMMKSAILPYFSEKGFLLKDLTSRDIQDFYTLQMERVSANTVIHYHAIIHRALKYAVKMDMIPANPADRIERPKKDKFVGSFYDSHEVNELFFHLEGHPLELPVKLGAFYGLRRSEILGLKWNAIDFTANTITIRHTVTSCNVDGKHIEVASDTTKTKSSMRTLPLVPDFRELLLRKKEEQAHYRRLCGRSYCTDYLDYVCVNELGERLKPNTLSSGFKRILETNGMRVIRLHDLRHSCASLLLANGVPMKQIQEWLGHSDFSTTANIYAHLDYHSKLSSAEAMLNGLGMTSHHNDLSLPAHEKSPATLEL